MKKKKVIVYRLPDKVIPLNGPYTEQKTPRPKKQTITLETTYKVPKKRTITLETAYRMLRPRKKKDAKRHFDKDVGSTA
jgi:hypothetical protein